MLTLASLPKPQEPLSRGREMTCNWVIRKFKEKKVDIQRCVCGRLSFRTCLPEQVLTFWSAQFHAVRTHPWKCPPPSHLVVESIWFNSKVWASTFCHRPKATFSNPVINSSIVEISFLYLYNFCFITDSEIRHMEKNVLCFAHTTQIIGTQY